MTTLASLQKQIQALQKKADAIRKTEVAEAIKKVKQLIGQFELTARDVGLEGSTSRGGTKSSTTASPKAKAKGGGAVKSAGVAKYRDPQSGKTWTGRGKPPAWIAGIADRSRFLIDGPSGAVETAMASASKPAKTAAATGKAKKGAAKKAVSAKSTKRTAKRAAAVTAQAQPADASAPKQAA
jgi:DNA-binding protein H-NS